MGLMYCPHCGEQSPVLMLAPVEHYVCWHCWGAFRLYDADLSERRKHLLEVAQQACLDFDKHVSDTPASSIVEIIDDDSPAECPTPKGGAN